MAFNCENNVENCVGMCNHSWVHLGREGSEHLLPGGVTIRYGCGDVWVKKILEPITITKVRATNDYWGVDPAPGIVKDLYVQVVHHVFPQQDITFEVRVEQEATRRMRADMEARHAKEKRDAEEAIKSRVLERKRIETERFEEAVRRSMANM